MKKLLVFILFLSSLISCRKQDETVDNTKLPTPPSNIKIGVLSKTKVKITWTDNSTNETGFNIQRKVTGSNTFVNVASLSTNSTNFTDTGLNSALTYVYKVSAANSAGINSASEDTVSIIPTMTTLPVSLMSNIVIISGGNVTNGGDSSITQRGVVWSTSPNPTIDLSTKTVDSLGELGYYRSYITTLSSNTTYHIRSYAVNPAGVGYGDDVTFTTDASNLKDGCVSYFVFGRTLKDIVNGHDATVNGSVPYSTDGITTDSTSLQMGNGYVTTPSIVYQFSGNFTISLWVKYVRSTSSQVLISTGDCQLQSTNGLVFSSYGALGFNDTLTNDPNWHNYIITYDSSQVRLYFYRDGVARTWSGGIPCSCGFTNNSFSIGANMDGTNKWLGKVDDVVTWSRLLTQEEIEYVSHH